MCSAHNRNVGVCRFPFVSTMSMSKHSLEGPEQLEYLQYFHRLATLNLSNQRKLRDNSLPFLLKAKGLTTISLRGCSRVRPGLCPASSCKHGADIMPTDKPSDHCNAARR